MRRFVPSSIFNAFTSKTIQSQSRHGSSRNKILTVEDAVYLVPNGATITAAGFVGQQCPEEVLLRLGERYLKTGEPKDLTLVFLGGPGDWDKKGLNHLAHPGMVKRFIGSHYGQTPMIGQLALNGKVASYNLPMGSVSRMMRAAISGSPGHITTIGMGTFADPKLGGGKINELAVEDLVKYIEINGKNYLIYQALPIDVALVRGTTADPCGNISMEKESLYNDNLLQAMAARSRRGLVIGQVERVSAKGSINPRLVHIPGTMVDAVIIAQPEYHWMSYITKYNPAASGEVKNVPTQKKLKLDERKLIARRSLLEVSANQVINLGIGMPEGVAAVADEEGIIDYFTLTTEPGVHGGVGLLGHDFGPAANFDALIDTNQQFDFYNGGGLDACFLGMAQTTFNGNVNVTRVGKKLTGPGGFVDISQSTLNVNIVGTFTNGGLKVEVEDGKLKILQEGKIKKFVKEIPEITFSGAEANRRRQNIKYITERCVFVLTNEGLELTEIAPGIDLQTQILDLMEYEPIMHHPIALMDAAIFKPEKMGICYTTFGLSLNNRIFYDAAANEMFITLRDMNLNKLEDVSFVGKSIREFITNTIPKEKHGKLNAVIGYDNFDVDQECGEEWKKLSESISKEFYANVERVSSAAFRRHHLGVALKVKITAQRFSLEEIEMMVETRCTKKGIDKKIILQIFRKIDKAGRWYLDFSQAEQLVRMLSK